jgi:nicotinamidase-related amidase
MKTINSLLSSGIVLFGMLTLCANPAAAELPLTLMQHAGVKSAPAHLTDSVLIIIDAQREYVDGKLPLKGIETSLREAKAVLDQARKAGTPVIHVVHKSKSGSALFNPEGPFVEIVDILKPVANESIVIKALPNSFTGTNLDELLLKLNRKNLIVIGYMTHMCVSSTVRAALDKGYRTTIVAKATATRDLPDGSGGVVFAQEVQRASLAALADRFAAIVQSAGEIQR